MTTTIGEALRTYLSERHKQSALARRWLELRREQAPAGKQWAPDTVETNLSRLLNDEPLGIRFFFDPKDPLRAELLFEVLEVPREDHTRLRGLADRLRQPGPRLIVDITAWPALGDALDLLFVELRQKVLRDNPLKPAALVLTEPQYGRLPRSYDDQINDRTLGIEKVATPADAPARVAELADTAVLVLAPRAYDPDERWLAADFDGKTLTLEPRDGLAAFAEHGALPAVPPVEHTLEAICEPAPITFQLEKLTATERRRWIAILASEAETIAAFEHHELARSPGERLTLARQLGVAATSIERERFEHALAQLVVRVGEALQIQVDTLDPAAHAERLARAALRPAPCAAWRCDDTIHLLHVDPPFADPRIVVHRPAPTVPALTRLLQCIAGWTDEDHEADPSLARAVEALDPEGSERAAFVHARATILWNDLRPPPPPAVPCERWAEALRELFAGDPPPAALRVRLPPPDGKTKDAEHEYLMLADDARVTESFAFQLDARVKESIASPWSLLTWPRGRRAVIVERGQEALLVSGSSQVYPLYIDTSKPGSVGLKGFWGHEVQQIYTSPEKLRSYQNEPERIPLLWLPSLSRTAPDVDLWQDCLERAGRLHGWKWEHSERCERLLRATGRRTVEMLFDRAINPSRLAIDASVWHEADPLLAQCWLALRLALERPLAVRLATGVVCSLGAGVCAHLAVHERRGGPPRGTLAAFDTTIKPREHGQIRDTTIDFASLWTHSASVGGYAAEFGVRVPARLVLRTPTLSADITFLASPLLQASTPQMIGTIAAAVAARIDDEEEAARTAYDD